MKEPLISVALCTYNGGKYIGEQLESIVAQSYKNIEIVIVDDASTDDTFNIITEWAGKDSRIRCHQNEANLGFNKNFEKAIALTTGDYIAISDQDDIWLADKLKLLFENIGGNWLIFSNSTYIGDKEGRPLLKDFKMPLDHRGFLLRNYVTGHTSMLSREFLSFALPFPDQGFYDWWMGFVAVYHQKAVFYNKVLTFYRAHDESVISKGLSLGKSNEYKNTLLMLEAFGGYKNLKQEDKKFIGHLEDAYRLRATGKRSVPLMKLIYKYYKALFPNRKSWKAITKIKFAFKQSKGINLPTE